MKAFNKEAFAALRTFLIMGLISGLGVWFTFSYAIEYSSFAVGIFKYVIAVTIVWAFDHFACPEVDTMALITKEPIAYAIFFMSNCILAAACIASS
jgi:hypothetical protein